MSVCCLLHISNWNILHFDGHVFGVGIFSKSGQIATYCVHNQLSLAWKDGIGVDRGREAEGGRGGEGWREGERGREREREGERGKEEGREREGGGQGGCLLTDISTIQSFLHDIIDPSAVQEMYYIQESKTTDTSAMKQM